MARKKGRPTKYKEEYNNIVYKLSLLGKTDEEMADILGVVTSTFNKWKIEHPEFSESITRGKDIADADVAVSLRERALGYSHEAVKIFNTSEGTIEHTYTEHYPPDTNAAAIWLYNRQPKKWKRQPLESQEEQTVVPVKVEIEVKDARADT